MHLDWSTARVAGVTLVSLCLSSDASISRSVRVENRLDGPVLPPRRHGVPECGWDDDGVELTLAPGATATIGYACPVPGPDGGTPIEPPVEVVENVPAILGRSGQPATEDTVRHALRDLGENRPPRAVIPTDGGLTRDDRDRDDTHGVDDTHVAHDVHDTTPEAVAAWLAAVEERVTLTEHLDGASVETATGALREVGGVDGADRLGTRVAADVEALRRVADRAASLADRAASASVSVEALRRLA